ncbi:MULTISPECIES: LysR family transcriptional regulator [Francisella]|uniref:LysR family transcriptional regulator n=1 Tax=Francisella opportunistica TaxID=2016517 RepID=A0A345JQS5_9GAMM|nr:MULTISPECIES: LysR family transcriptional regulator [Francisella]APC91378.1 Transcriptional regulator [Francisella sp. MA067296]AXH29671.1 LysR family transcriptional regulator [Francisella opportunistica]AXH31321.1 LysR family transcriptional regulator [Francisella opportunistica]AXH32967.1 LysR family transcriptional regulator [Francisella opportunistica]
MNNIYWRGIYSFIHVAEQQSFTKAADILGIAKSNLSQNIKNLENHLKVQLLYRSTRHVRLTEIGQEYYQNCKKALQDLDVATELTSQVSNQLSGIIKVNSVGGILGEEVVAPILLRFQQQNPKVNIHLDFSSHKVNLLDSDYDLVIRMGNLADSNLIVSSLRTVATKYVASSDFIQKHGQITNPRQLENLPLIYGSVKQWSLVSTEDKYTLHIHNNSIHITSGRVMKQAALAGLGITRLVDVYVESDIKNGNLIEVLPDYAETTQLSIISLPVKYQLKRISSLIKYLKQHFNQIYLEMLSNKK